MAQTDQGKSSEERSDLGVFTAVGNGMLEIIESLMPDPPRFSGPFGLGLDAFGNLAEQQSDGKLTGREIAESAGSLAIGAAVSAVVGSAISGAAAGFLGAGPLGAIAGVVIGGAAGYYASPIGGTVGGWLYDQVMKEAPQLSSTDQLRKYIDKMVDPNFQWFRDDLKNNPSIPVPPEYKNPLSPSRPPVTVGGPPTTVQTPSGPQVVNPGSTYVPPGSAPPPAPKPAIPPTVTWGPMANPGVPGGSGPVVKDKGNLQPTTRDSARDRQADQRPVGGGSGSGSSGGGASGGGSGGSGGTRSTGPSFEYSGRSGSGGKTTSNSSPAGGWGDMAKAGYGKSTGSGSSGNKSGSGSSGKTDKGGRRPIILDLGGDGFDVSFAGTARFDMDGDGFRERVGWADAQDALLVLDLNADGSRGAGDGKIDQAKEVVLSLWGDAGMTDMEALAKARDASAAMRVLSGRGNGARRATLG